MPIFGNRFFSEERKHRNLFADWHTSCPVRQALEDVICATNVKNFYMIYSGPFPPNPAELLGGKNFRSLLNALRKVYDYVIVDTPPLGSVIDSAIVAEICDGSIMVIESGVISYRFAQEVKSQLEKK